MRLGLLADLIRHPHPTDDPLVLCRVHPVKHPVIVEPLGVSARAGAQLQFLVQLAHKKSLLASIEDAFTRRWPSSARARRAPARPNEMREAPSPCPARSGS